MWDAGSLRAQPQRRQVSGVPRPTLPEHLALLLTALNPQDGGEGREVSGLPRPPYPRFGLPPPLAQRSLPHPGSLMSPSYLLPARLPTSFPNLCGNKASVHSQGLAGQGGTGQGVVGWGGAAIWRVGGMGGGAPSCIMALGHPRDLD